VLFKESTDHLKAESTQLIGKLTIKIFLAVFSLQDKKNNKLQQLTIYINTESPL